MPAAIFDEIGAIYQEIDNKYASIVLTAQSRGHHIKEAKYIEKRKLNDHAYFLFMFTRLEDRIKNSASELFKNKVASITNRTNKRAWEIIKKKNEDDHLTLMDKVSFFLTSGNADYNLIFRYKKQRDTIAHGGFIIHGGNIPPLNMPVALVDFKTLYDLF